jgi:hypothetical protein
VEPILDETSGHIEQYIEDDTAQQTFYIGDEHQTGTQIFELSPENSSESILDSVLASQQSQETSSNSSPGWTYENGKAVGYFNMRCYGASSAFQQWSTMRATIEDDNHIEDASIPAHIEDDNEFPEAAAMVSFAKELEHGPVDIWTFLEDRPVCGA